MCPSITFTFDKVIDGLINASTPVHFILGLPVSRSLSLSNSPSFSFIRCHRHVFFPSILYPPRNEPNRTVAVEVLWSVSWWWVETGPRGWKIRPLPARPPVERIDACLLGRFACLTRSMLQDVLDWIWMPILGRFLFAACRRNGR